MVMEEVLEVIIMATFRGHIYKWGNKLYQQVKGGAIGLMLTGSVAKLIMDSWMEKFRVILDANGLITYILRKNVDDIFCLH